MNNKLGDILSEKWYYQQRKDDLSAESERIVRTAAKLLKESIKSYEIDTANYPELDDTLLNWNQILFLNFCNYLSGSLSNLR